MHWKDVTNKTILKIKSEEQMKMKLDFKLRSFQQQLGDVEGKRKKYSFNLYDYQ